MIKVLALAAILLAACGQEKIIVVVPPGAGNRVQYAGERLERILDASGYDASLTDRLPEGDNKHKVISLTVSTQDSLKKEGYTITTEGNVTTVCGNDPSGVIYGTCDLTDRLQHNRELELPDRVTDAPEMVLRGTCIGVQKTYILPGYHVYEYPYTPENFPWFYDKERWIKYLDMLVDNRMNSLYLWNGHPFASLVKLPDYPFAVEVDDATFEALSKEYPWYAKFQIPAGTYPDQDKAVQTTAVKMILITDASLPEDVIYDLTKCFWENQDIVKNSHAVMKDITLEGAVTDLAGIPLHPGAAKYYKDVGVLK